MTRKQLEDRLAAAVEHAQPDILDELLRDCAPQSKGSWELNPGRAAAPHRSPRGRRPLAIAAALALVLVGALTAWQLAAARVPVARVSLDVNPSVEFTLNRGEKLLEIVPCNPDAEIMLQGLELEHRPMDEAVETLLEALAQGGWLNEQGGAVLISVDGAPEIGQALTRQVREGMEARTLNGEILSQQVENSEGLDAQADAWNTSFGRAAYYEKIAQTAQLDPAQMAGLSVQQAEYLLESRGLSMEQAGIEVEVDDDLSQSDLVGRTLLAPEEALAQALAAAGVSAADAVRPEVELDADHGRLVYEVEVHYSGREYEVTLDAQTGALLEQKSDPDDDDLPADTSRLIGEQEALRLALSAAGVDAASAAEKKSELDREDGRLIYEVEFTAGGIEHEFDLDAVTGAVLKHELDRD